METEQVSDHEEEHRSRNTSREDELVKEGVGEVNQPHLIAVGPGKVVENRLVFYVNVCNKFYKMRHGTLNLKGECTLVCCNAQPYRGRASCGAKSKLRVLDDSLYTQDESSMVPKFVQGAPNLFNSDSYRIEMYEKSHPHTCCGENITYEEIRFMLSNVRIINPKRFQIESGDPNCKPSEELASIESGVCMGCSRKFSETDLLIEHILKFHRCSDTYVATYANFCFICMESHKFLKTHYCDVNNSKIQTSAALKELHIATWEIYNGEPWQSKLVNRVEILPSKLRRSVLGNSLNEDKIFDESAKGFNCYPVESGQCSSCHDNCETWQGLFDHLEDNRYYLCREYYTYKGYCFICSKFYSKVSQHFNDVRRGKCSSLATETREIHKEFQERFIFKKPEFPATPRTSTPQKKSSNSAVSCGDGSMTMLNNRGEQILLPEKCHNIESGKCSSCLEQFDSWECLVDHLRENQDCQNYCTQRYASYCFICSRPYKNVKGHFNDILGGKVNCSVDIRRIHRTMKPLYIPIPRLNRMVKTGKRSKKRVIQKTQSANSSDEDESFHVRKKCRNRIGPLGMATPSPSNMKEQVIEGDGKILRPFLNAITVGLKQSPRFYVTVDGRLRILRWKSFSYQKETMRLNCCHKSCINVCHIVEVKNKSLIKCRGTPEAHVDWISPEIFDIHSYSMLSHETNDHKCTVTITLEEIRKIQRRELELQNYIKNQPLAHEKRITPKRSSVKSKHSKYGVLNSNDEDDDERITLEDSEDDSDGLDEESEPDSDDLMESTENSSMGSPMKPIPKKNHEEISKTDDLTTKNVLNPVTPLSDDDDMEDVQPKTIEPKEAIPKKFQYSSASSDTDNPDNPSMSM
ncbi:unnamed protein product [Oikopleura dioica]|uniref:C2H2-type domain-containing protein n=1 Tax=Oikopleura dioica TaxID=34765 RepID=E4Y7H3_OIKDI|nr:unnamed protein product [Oikopleura dioica]